MSPNLLLYPVSDKRKAFTRIADSKVVHPTTKDRVDLLDHSLHRLANILSEDLLQLCQQRRPVHKALQHMGSTTGIVAELLSIRQSLSERPSHRVMDQVDVGNPLAGIRRDPPSEVARRGHRRSNILQHRFARSNAWLGLFPTPWLRSLYPPEVH
jgi:hypothetical protein